MGGQDKSSARQGGRLTPPTMTCARCETGHMPPGSEQRAFRHQPYGTLMLAQPTPQHATDHSESTIPMQVAAPAIKLHKATNVKVIRNDMKARPHIQLQERASEPAARQVFEGWGCRWRGLVEGEERKEGESKKNGEQRKSTALRSEARSARPWGASERAHSA